MSPQHPPLRRAGVLTIEGIEHGFSSREGGISVAPFDTLNLSTRVGDNRASVVANRTALLGAIHRPDAGLAVLKQVHGAHVVQLTARAGPNIEADAAFSTDRNLALAVLAADCVPVLLADAHARVIAMAHAGWRGTEKNIVQALVARLVTAGFPADTLRAAVGPAIGQCCYEVQEDVAQALALVCPNTRVREQAILPKQTGFYIDLAAINVEQLSQAGLPPGNIEALKVCTFCHADLFSHRRDATETTATGRHAGVIAFKNLTPP